MTTETFYARFFDSLQLAVHLSVTGIQKFVELALERLLPAQFGLPVLYAQSFKCIEVFLVDSFDLLN